MPNEFIAPAEAARLFLEVIDEATASLTDQERLAFWNGLSRYFFCGPPDTLPINGPALGAGS